MASNRVLIWFKRDLRVHDHAPLVAAQVSSDALGVFIFEPEWLGSPECDASHIAFTLDCLHSLRSDLAQRGLPLLVRVGSAVAVLSQLHAEFGFSHLLSHEETGPGWSYARDRAVAQWCRSQQVRWHAFPQNGVVRPLRSRRGWAAAWQARMDAPLEQLAQRLKPATTLDQPELPNLHSLGFGPHHKTLQTAGERAARQTLRSFLHERGQDYRRALSSPLRAESGCSRLSPYLAFGCISLRTVHQATEHAIAHAPDRDFAYALRGFAGRLRWHCHFMQKLEDEPAIEIDNFARVCDGLREDSFNESHFEAWCAGQTGYPMVDACMRSLKATGWLNFRMRAMLVSFASYHLWLHWRPTGLFLARHFLDFEAGIHWSQMQMQSGTTGINTLRMYSPVKQARDHDPEGTFIRRWVPELQRVPLPYLAAPWEMDVSVQRLAACHIGSDYPAPIVNEREALHSAKLRLYGLRANPIAREEAAAIQTRHGSRKSGLAQSAGKRSPTASGARAKRRDAAANDDVQGDLF